MSAITIPHKLPADLLVLSIETIERKDELIAKAHSVPITSVEEMKAADQVAKDIARLFKGVDEQRKQLGRELDAVKDQVKQAADEALLPLRQTWDALAKRIRGFEDEENARREQLRRAAEAEAKKRQEEEEARAARAAQEAKERAELENPPDLPAAPPEISVETLPARIEPAFTPPPIKSSAVGNKGGKVVTVTDERAVPFEINGVRLWKEPNKAAIKTLWDNGVEVPGTIYAKPDGYAMRGGRA